jgi:hypothetical protein
LVWVWQRRHESNDPALPQNIISGQHNYLTNLNSFLFYFVCLLELF